MKKSISIPGFCFIVWNIFFFAEVSNLHASDPFTQVVLPDTGNFMSCSWGDYDADGYDDLFCGNDYGHNILYHNNCNGTFSRVTSGEIAQSNKHGWGSTWGDYDGDGDLDLFISRFARSEDLLYSNNADGTFELITSNAIVINSGSNYSSSWADYDNDNDLDLFVPVTYNIHDMNNVLYQNNGDGTYTTINDGDIVNDLGSSESCSWGDYDNDGYPDLFVANYEENNFLYHNNGDGTFTKITVGPIVNESSATFGGSWGDFDNDGDLDLFIANDDAQDNSLYRNEGAGTFSKILTGEIVNDGGNSVGTAWGDFDNDGDLDLFVSNRFDENNFLYMNNGDGTFTENTSSCITNDKGNSTGCASSDFDLDGDLDICIANWSPAGNQKNWLYVNNGNDNNYINIRCIGIISNSSAIGVKIRLKANIYGNSSWQLRELSAAAGYCAQNSLRAHFGLGDATTIDSIKIEWPSGICQISTDEPVNTSLTFVEPTDSKYGDQFNPKIACAHNEGYIHIARYVKAWFNMIGSKRNVMAQRLNVNNSPLEDPFKVNDLAWGSSPYLYEILNISVSDDGSFVVVWEQDDTQKIYGQKYSYWGYKEGSNFEISNAKQPAIALHDNGSFLVVYKYSYGIRGQRFNRWGVPIGDEIIVSKIMEYHRYPAIDVTPHGDYIVVWEAEVSMGVVRIYGQRFDSEGNSIGGNFRIDDDPDFYWKSTPDIATSYDGSFVVVWKDYRGDDYGIFGQRYDSSGNKTGVNFKINDIDVIPNPRAPAISFNSDGNFVVSWEDYRNGDADIYCQRFNHQGAMIGSNYRIDDDTGHSEQKNPDVASSKNQIFHIWQDNRVSAEGWNIKEKVEEIKNVTIHVPYDYATIQGAIDAASFGDTILVAPGIYDLDASIINDRIDNLSLCGSREEDGNNSSIINAAVNPGTYPAIHFNNLINCNIAGFEIKNAHTGILLDHCSNCSIQNNYVHDNDEVSSIHGNGVMITYCHDIYVKHCIFDQNEFHAIDVNNSHDIFITFNTILRTMKYDGIMIAENCNEIGIEENIIAWNKQEGIEISATLELFNQGWNCFWQNGGLGNICVGGTQVQPIGPLSFDADPMLVDIDNQNYYLLPGSPCLGAGVYGEDIGALGLQPTTCLLGDVNDDGEVTPGDAL
ncbi:VCBS repeat-containing protein, partial [candidate division KSB1 bacterium]|nr:VCBS repeat-containing protein [candidate division KSB1 bacterium]